AAIKAVRDTSAARFLFPHFAVPAIFLPILRPVDFVPCSLPGEGIRMYHAVWKLTALAVVVGIGVFVVVQAQRGMLDTDAAVDTEGASRESDDEADGQLANLNDSGGPPVQGEPDVAG